MATRNENPLLKQALSYHEYGWCVIPIKPGSKKPALRSWKPFQTNRPGEKQLRKWFANNNGNIAVVLGVVSGGLTALDFDSLERYEWWKEKCADLAEKLPTVKTSKGMHVYFRSKLTKSKKYNKTDLKASGYVILPPSMHESGVRYEWIIPLPENIDELPLLKPLDWHLDQFTEDTEEAEDSEDTQDAEGHISHKGEEGFLDYLDDEIKKEVEIAIKNTLPKKVGQRNDAVFPFCQWLRAIPELRSLPTKELKPIVREWHKKAYPVIGTKSFTVTWADFVHAWKRVKWPKGDIMLSQAVKRVLEGKTILPEAEEYDTEEARFLLKVCYELQQGTGDEPFFLASRTAGGIIGISHRWAYKLLEMFVADGKLDCVEKHTTKKAPRYRYIAN
jgi:hypothetical protein